MAKKMTEIEILEEALGGDREVILFFLSYLKHNRNATRAYKALHPNCTLKSCGVLGARMMSKISVQAILDSYGLGVDTYISKLQQGLNASETEIISAKVSGKGKNAKVVMKRIERPNHSIQKAYHETLGKLLGLEGKKEENTTNVAVQVNNLIQTKKNEYGI